MAMGSRDGKSAGRVWVWGCPGPTRMSHIATRIRTVPRFFLCGPGICLALSGHGFFPDFLYPHFQSCLLIAQFSTIVFNYKNSLIKKNCEKDLISIYAMIRRCNIHKSSEQRRSREAWCGLNFFFLLNCKRMNKTQIQLLTPTTSEFKRLP